MAGAAAALAPVAARGPALLAALLVVLALAVLAVRLRTGAVARARGAARALLATNVALESRATERAVELAAANAALERAVADHERALAELRASQDEARAIIDTAFDAYIAMDAEGRVLEWNRQAERLFGWARTEAVGRDLAELIIPPPLRQAHRHGLANFLSTGEGTVLNRRVEMTALHRDGHEVPVSMTIWATPMGVSWKFNAFLHDVQRQWAIRRLAVETATATALLESASLEEAAPRVLQTICERLGLAVGLLWQVDAELEALRCVAAWERDGGGALVEASRHMLFPRGTGLPGRVWAEGQAEWLSDAAEDMHFARQRHARHDGLHAAFAFPLVGGEQVLGVAEFYAPAAMEADPELLETVQTLGNLLGQFIARKQAEHALEVESEFLATVLDSITEGIVACDEHGTLTLFNRATREMHGLPEQPLPPEQWASYYSLYRADGVTPLPMEENPLLRAFHGERVHNQEIVIAPKDRPAHIVVCNGQSMVTQSGRKAGAVVALHDITERKQAEERLQQLAHFDTLTGLPNRRLFYQSLYSILEQAAANRWLVAVLFVDVDHFKTVNDTLGHVVGDELLRQVGQRLVNCLRVRDTVGRLGGDEFGIILVAPQDPQGAVIVADKLKDAFREPLLLEGREVQVTLSIGITVFPDDARDADTLIRYADTAMYAAKEAGRDGYRFYTAEMNAQAMARLDLEVALRKALDRGEFVLHYQPKVDLASGRCIGAEALLRWERPGHGLVPPGEFVPMLEATGLIVPVGEWIIEEACAQIARWQARGLEVAVAVNVSGRQAARILGERNGGGDAAQHPLAEVAARCLAAHAVPPGLLEFELTESTLMAHAESTVKLLQRLRELGIRLAIDDFGTGYSSLAYLRRFPIDVVKIDGHFVRDVTTNPEDAAMARAIVSMAHNLRLHVVAECVETAEQLAFLREEGCDLAQGYLFGRPLPADAFEALLREREGRWG
ncbi:sensor domain-containing protein [Vulcaniibacterium gelatinicum]|uniref:sensor domain-containing protein n=1 Tax=Vulcaniibacterium gelatinicum TaxID=2598725 RepID=UPI0015F2C6BB|nr:EAL domain-containing protein [Vulcaniibacterium gelatinicum]